MRKQKGGSKIFKLHPDFSRAAFVHLRGLQGAAVVRVPQPYDNAANERMRLAQRVKIAEKKVVKCLEQIALHSHEPIQSEPFP